MISVIIATKDRPQKIKACLQSILENTHKDFEIILADQSCNTSIQQVIKKNKSRKIVYLKLISRGKTKALNKAIDIARGEILSFIDDDIIVDKLWLERIQTFFDQNKNNQQIAGVFGKILPYKPNQHKNQICPSIFTLNRKAFITNSYVTHYEELGLGSNMSLKKEVLYKIGYFREWLGPGYLGLGGGEDGELIYRLLKNKYFLAYNPSIRAYHNRWLTYEENKIQQGRYTYGEVTFCFYYFLTGDLRMGRIILDKMIERIFNNELKYAIKNFVNINKKHTSVNIKGLLKELIFSGWEIIYIIKGLLIATYIRFSEDKKPKKLQGIRCN